VESMSARTTNEPASAKDMRPAWRAQRGRASADRCIMDDGGVHPSSHARCAMDAVCPMCRQALRARMLVVFENSSILAIAIVVESMSARTTNEPASAKDMRPAWRAQRGRASADRCIMDDGGVHPSSHARCAMDAVCPMCRQALRARMLVVFENSSILAIAIVVDEALFWVLLFGGLVARYLLRRRRLSTVLLAGAPVVDLVLVALTLTDVARGSEPSGVHALAAVYL